MVAGCGRRWASPVAIEGRIDAGDVHHGGGNGGLRRGSGWTCARFTKTATLKRRNPVKIAGHRIRFCDEYRNLNTAHHV